MMQSDRAIGMVGTFGRACLGCFFLYTAYLYGVGLLDVVLGIIIFPVVLLLWQQWRSRQTVEPLNATGPIGFVVNFAIAIILFSIPITRVATLIFYGISLFLAARAGPKPPIAAMPAAPAAPAVNALRVSFIVSAPSC